ncbi:sigma 54-interacting transcriptional regulator [Lysinibacillus fusiformis]|uniref:sigma 54-interacting transcriptional regulator n=1 Tax=Lysinibacillus fusiformis TaxID=28031 RepID=UPI00380697B9
MTGKTGTGKDSIAQDIHNESERYTKLFITLNCSTLTEDNIFTQLYGSENEKKCGELQEANGGTLLIDQIDLPPLRMRKKDITAILDFYIQFYNEHTVQKNESYRDEVL